MLVPANTMNPAVGAIEIASGSPLIASFEQIRHCIFFESSCLSKSLVPPVLGQVSRFLQIKCLWDAEVSIECTWRRLCWCSFHLSVTSATAVFNPFGRSVWPEKQLLEPRCSLRTGSIWANRYWGCAWKDGVHSRCSVWHAALFENDLCRMLWSWICLCMYLLSNRKSGELDMVLSIVFSGGISDVSADWIQYLAYLRRWRF